MTEHEEFKKFERDLRHAFSALDQPGTSAASIPFGPAGDAMYEAEMSPETLKRRFEKGSKRFDELVTREVLQTLFEGWKEAGATEDVVWHLAQKLANTAKEREPAGSGCAALLLFILTTLALGYAW